MRRLPILVDGSAGVGNPYKSATGVSKTAATGPASRAHGFRPLPDTQQHLAHHDEVAEVEHQEKEQRPQVSGKAARRRRMSRVRPPGRGSST